MADALCGPSNPLQNFQKHTAADRTIQQDRLTARPSPPQVSLLQARCRKVLTDVIKSFRSSPGANAGILDAEFEAFQAGFSPGPRLPELQQFHNAIPTSFRNTALPPTAAPGWASDFQQLQISGRQLPIPQYQDSPQTSLPRSASGGWRGADVQQHGVMTDIITGNSVQMRGTPSVNGQIRNDAREDYEREFISRAQRSNRQLGGHALMDYQTQLELLEERNRARLVSMQQGRERLKETDGQEVVTGSMSFQPGISEWQQENNNVVMMNGTELLGPSVYRDRSDRPTSTTQQHEPRQRVEDVFDDAAFERAFEAARSEMQHREQQRQKENLELGQDVLINESDERLLQSDHLVEQERIGSDTILHEARDEIQELQQSDDPDELARTAGQLLDSVKYDQSQKFQESNFLALMRRLRDREVRVEGDKVVEVSSTSSSAALQHHHGPPPELITCRVFECEVHDG